MLLKVISTGSQAGNCYALIAECNFAHLTQNKKYFHCDAKNKTVYNAKPDWCPIKEIPERLEELKQPHSINDYQRKGFSKGFNSCLDEIERKM